MSKAIVVVILNKLAVAALLPESQLSFLRKVQTSNVDTLRPDLFSRPILI